MLYNVIFVKQFGGSKSQEFETGSIYIEPIFKSGLSCDRTLPTTVARNTDIRYGLSGTLVNGYAETTRVYGTYHRCGCFDGLSEISANTQCFQILIMNHT